MKPETKDRMKRVLKTSKKLLDDTKDDVDEIKKRKRKIEEGARE